MKTTDGKVDYYIDIDYSIIADLPTYSIPESHIMANLVYDSVKPIKPTKPIKPIKRKRKSVINKK